MADKLIGGRYRPLERHAVGGMATLWRARDERTGEVVALKRLHPFLVADSNARARLAREAAALEAVDHPSITRPRDVIDDPDDPALVMDFAKGRSLSERLAAEGPLNPEEAVAIVATVADALAIAHDAGIVHRDVKPANILVEDSGAVHLVDFGIATLGPADEAGLTAAGTVVGTVRYAAPERLAGAASTPRSDVWGLGAVLYELLTGRPATDRNEHEDMPGLPTARMPGPGSMPPTLARVVGRALARDPAARYADAGTFRDALLGEGDFADADADADTTVIPMPAMATHRPGPGGPGRSGRLSVVDRTAAVFFGGALAVTLAVAGVIGLGGEGQSGVPASEPPAQVIDIAPSPTDEFATPEPDRDGRGRGNGNGGNGKGKGNDKDDGGGD